MSISNLLSEYIICTYKFLHTIHSHWPSSDELSSSETAKRLTLTATLISLYFDKLHTVRDPLIQGQKFVAVLKAKNRGAATSQNVKNRGIVAAKIVKIAAMSRQES